MIGNNCDNLSEENLEFSAVSRNQRNQLKECMDEGCGRDIVKFTHSSQSIDLVPAQ